MKNFDLQEIIKEAVKEGVLAAFAQMSGVSTLSEEAETPSDSTDKEGGNSAENSGGGLNNGRPKPDVGVGVFGLR